MKPKYFIKKEIQNKNFKRTLNLENRIRSQTSKNSKKNLSLSTIENNITLKKPKNKSRYNTIILPRAQTNKKIKINKNLTIKTNNNNYRKIFIKKYTTEENHKYYKNTDTYTTLPILNCQNTIDKYQKIITYTSQKDSQKKNNTSLLLHKQIMKNRNKTKQANLKQNIIFRTPLRIRKNGSNGGVLHKLSSDNSKNNITEYNNNNIIIENMKKEIDFLKKEKEFKNNFIEKMKQQIQEDKKKQEILKENKKLKKELNVLKANFRYDGKIYNEIDLFEKFKNEYLTYKSQATKLKDENSALLKKLNFKMYNNLLIRKNIEIQIISKVNNKKENGKLIGNNNMNKYIEKVYKSELKKLGENINDYEKPLKKKQLNEIRYLIKLIFHSNQIEKEIVLNLIINNLMNFNEILNLLIQRIKTESTSDKILLKNYYTTICFDNNKNKSKNFNIYNIFDEIKFYFTDIENLKKNIDFDDASNDRIKRLMKECTNNDKINNGLIELNQFNSIFKSIYGDYHYDEKIKELYDTFIIIMKNYNNLKNLDLYNLYYKNLDNYIIKEKLPRLNKLKYYIDSNLNIDKNDKKENSIEQKNKINTNLEDNESKICNDFVSELFNDCLIEKKNDKENIENICQDFVSNIFSECQTKNQNTYTLKVCQDFVSDIFSECKRRNSNLNHACKDFVGDPFDSCLEDQVIKRKKY